MGRIGVVSTWPKAYHLEPRGGAQSRYSFIEAIPNNAVLQSLLKTGSDLFCPVPIGWIDSMTLDILLILNSLQQFLVTTSRRFEIYLSLRLHLRRVIFALFKRGIRFQFDAWESGKQPTRNPTRPAGEGIQNSCIHTAKSTFQIEIGWAKKCELCYHSPKAQQRILRMALPHRIAASRLLTCTP